MKRWATMLLVGLFLSAGQSLHAQSSSLTLIRGVNHVMSPGYKIGRTSIGDPGVCDFVVPKDRMQIILVPKGRGTTNLILFDTKGVKRDSYQVQVVPDLTRLAQDLAQLFENITGIEILIKQDRIFIRGSVYSEKDFQFVAKQVSGVSDVVVNEVRLDPEALDLLAQEIEKAIRRQEIHARVLKDSILLEGFAYSKSQLERAESIARSLSPDRVVNVIELKDQGRFFRDDKMVHFDIRFVSIRYTDLRDWGLDWGNTLGESKSSYTLTDGKTEDFDWKSEAILENFLPSINILVDEGAGKQLLNPRIICKNGETAREVVDGGEVPVIVVTNNNVSVTYKEFGIIVEVSPLVDKDDNVDVQISVAAVFPSDVVRGQGVFAQAFSKDEVKTSVILRKNQTLVLSGLLSNRLRRNFSGWPFLGKIPLIRHFFGAKRLDLNKAELVIFVTPTVLTPMDGIPEVDAKLKEKLEFDIGVEPKFSVDFSSN